MNEVEYHRKQVFDPAPAEIQEQIPIDCSENKQRNDLLIQVASFMKNQSAQLNPHKHSTMRHYSTIIFRPERGYQLKSSFICLKIEEFSFYVIDYG